MSNTELIAHRMRLLIKVMEPDAPGHIPRHLTRGGHMATYGVINTAFNLQADGFNSLSRRHNRSILPSGSRLLQWFAELRWFAEFAVSLHLGMVPLNGECPAHCDEPSARTATGRSCSLYSCIEFC